MYNEGRSYIYMCRFALVIIFLIAAFTFNLSITYADEDQKGPEVISVDVSKYSYTAGETIVIDAKVKEEDTGIVRAEASLNLDTTGMPVVPTAMLEISDVKNWDTPLISHGEDYIDIHFEINTENAYNGHYALYIQFYDMKGNGGGYVTEDDYPFIITGGRDIAELDSNAPILHSVSLKNVLIEKPGKLTVNMDITNKSVLNYVQIDLANTEDESYEIIKNNFSIPQMAGRNDYSFSIPIGENVKNGKWRVQAVYLRSKNGLETGYYYDEGKLRNNMYSEYAIDSPEFTVRGVAGDDTRPDVNVITVKNENSILKKPGLLTVLVSVIEDGSGITSLRIEAENMIHQAFSYDREFTLKDFPDNKPLYTGVYEFNIPIPSVAENGEYQVYVPEMYDKAGNNYRWFLSEYDAKAPFTVEDEFSYDFEVSITNDSLLSRVQAMDTGKVCKILLTGKLENNILDKAVLDAIAGQDKTLVCYRDAYQWIINGLDLSPDNTKSLNLHTTITSIPAEYLGTTQNAICVSFQDNGELPGTIQFRFKSSFVNKFVGNEKSVRMYYVTQKNTGSNSIDYSSDTYEKIDDDEANIQIIPDDINTWCYVDISHNSKYIISSSTIKGYDLRKAKISLLKKKYVYNDKYIKPAVTVTVRDKKLTKNTDFTVTYSNNKKIGTATITIKSKKNNTKKTIKFSIIPKSTAFRKIKRTGSSIKVKWKRVKNISGYRIQYSTKKSFKGAKVEKISKRKVSHTITRINKNKKYYIRISTYKTVNGKKYISRWITKRK